MLIPAFAPNPKGRPTSSEPGADVVFLPPAGFQAAGIIRSASFCATGEADRLSARNISTFGTGVSRVPMRPALQAGLRYEKKVHAFVAEAWKSFGSYLAGPWIEFYSSGGKRKICQPDGLLTFHSGAVLIVEIKVSHTQNAWWQLRQLYEPVMKALTKYSHPIYILEICKAADLLMMFPEPVKLIPSVVDVKDCWNRDFNVLVLDL